MRELDYSFEALALLNQLNLCTNLWRVLMSAPNKESKASKKPLSRILKINLRKARGQLLRSPQSSRQCVGLLDARPYFKPKVRHQNENIEKYFLRRLPFSRFIVKINTNFQIENLFSPQNKWPPYCSSEHGSLSRQFYAPNMQTFSMKHPGPITLKQYVYDYTKKWLRRNILSSVLAYQTQGRG